MRKEALRIEQISVKSDNGTLLKIGNLNLLVGESISFMGLKDSGAGKLLDVICGKSPYNSGKVFINEKVVNYANDAAARYFGIYRISDDQTLVDELNIAENIFVLRRNSLQNFFLNPKILHDQASILLNKIGVKLSPSTLVGKLTIPEKNLIELAKAIGSGAKIIIFEDVFSFYDRADLDRLQHIVNRLKDEGISFIFRCNYIDEARQFSEHIIFFKDGTISKKISSNCISETDIADYILGYRIQINRNLRKVNIGNLAFEAKNIILPNSARLLNFSIHQGEVVTLFDVDTNDIDAIAQVLSGTTSNPQTSLFLNNNLLDQISPDSFFQKKIILIHDLFNNSSVVENLSIGENLAIPSLEKISGFAGFVNHDIFKMLEKQYFLDIGTTHNTPNQLTNSNKLSLLLERWFIYNPNVLILVDPFSKADELESEIIIEYINKFAKSGTAIIILASKSNKAFDISDQLILINEDDFRKSPAIIKDQSTHRVRSTINNIIDLIISGLDKYKVAIILIAGYFFIEHSLIKAETIYILLIQISILGFAALGVYLTTLCDGFNFSVGAQAAITSVIVVILADTYRFPLWLILVITFLVSIMLGLLYSIVTIKTGIPIILFSFAMMYVLTGIIAQLQNLYTGNTYVGIHFLANANLNNIPVAFIVFIFIMFLVWFFIRFTFLGKSLYAVGSNMLESQRSGLNVNIVKIFGYMIGFSIINITGLLFQSRTSMGSFLYGSDYFIDVLVAFSLGRISLWGGKGSLKGVMVGVSAVILLDSFLIISGLGLFYGKMIKGIIIIAFILLDDKFIVKFRRFPKMKFPI